MQIESSPMRGAHNLIWLLCGGFVTAMGYVFGGMFLCLTIVGIPSGLQLIKLSQLAFMPFDYRVVWFDQRGAGCLSALMSLLWLICGGVWLVFWHLLWGILLSITIVGMPFGQQHFKLARIALVPFGRNVVSSF